MWKGCSAPRASPASRTFETQVRRGPEGPVFFWREDEEYDGEGGAAASGARHRLEVGALPWIYTRVLI